MSQREFRNFWESPRKSWYDKKLNFRIDFEFWCLAPLQGSRWRVIQVKKSPCEGWLRFLVGQKRSSSHLVILKSRTMSPPAYFLHLWKCQYCARVYWNLSYPLLSILKVIFLESNPLRFLETLISLIRSFVCKQQWRHFGKGTQCGTVLREM
jgi:hypothetical protein